MFDDIFSKKPSKEKTIQDALAASGVGKCRECTAYQNTNGLCNKIVKIVHPDQIGCLDFQKK
jgi:hypothetical protein